MEYFTFQSDLQMNENSVKHNYLKLIIERYGKEQGEEFVKQNPLVFNSELNRYQSFPIEKNNGNRNKIIRRSNS